MRGAAVAVLAALVLAACASGGTSTTSGAATGTSGGAPATSTTSTSLATTKFALHAGLAVGAFHQLIYKPIQAGTIGNPVTLLQAVAAGVFTYHEAQLAYRDAQSSQTLNAVAAPFNTLINKVKALYAGLKGGHVPSTADVLAIQGDVNNIRSIATASGNPIKEMTPTAAQLAAGVAP